MDGFHVRGVRMSSEWIRVRWVGGWVVWFCSVVLCYVFDDGDCARGGDEGFWRQSVHDRDRKSMERKSTCTSPSPLVPTYIPPTHTHPYQRVCVCPALTLC